MSDKQRVLNELRRTGHVRPSDFLGPHTVDGGKPILRVAARIADLRAEGVEIVTSETRPQARYELQDSLARVTSGASPSDSGRPTAETSGGSQPSGIGERGGVDRHHTRVLKQPVGGRSRIEEPGLTPPVGEGPSPQLIPNLEGLSHMVGDASGRDGGASAGRPALGGHSGEADAPLIPNVGRAGIAAAMAEFDDEDGTDWWEAA